MSYFYAIDPDVDVALARFKSEEYRDKWVAGEDTYNAGCPDLCAGREALTEKEAMEMYGDAVGYDDLWEPDVMDDEIEWLYYDIICHDGCTDRPAQYAERELPHFAGQVVA